MGNVTVFGDVADKYDALVAYDEKALDHWVESEGYSTSSMVLASTALAFIRFAQTFTDIGRLGNGIFIEGGWKGVGKDALRAVNLVGSAGAILGRAGQLFRVIQMSEAGTCTFAAQANALRLTGTRFFITAEELIRKVGGNLDRINQFGAGSEEYQQLLSWLERLGIPNRVLMSGVNGAARSFEALEDAIQGAPQGVVTFGIKATGRLSRFGQVVSREHLVHRLYATYSATGGLKIFDPLGPTFNSFEELSAAFRDLQLTRAPIILVKNSVMVTASHLAQRATELSTVVHQLALQVLPVVPVPASDAETAAQVISLRDQRTSKPPTSTSLGSPSVSSPSPSTNSYTVSSGDTLSGIAKQRYGDEAKWPLIYLENRDTIGPNPDLIKPGQQLYLPTAADFAPGPPVQIAPLR